MNSEMSYEGVRQTKGHACRAWGGANNVEVLQPEEYRAVCTLCGQLCCTRRVGCHGMNSRAVIRAVVVRGSAEMSLREPK